MASLDLPNLPAPLAELAKYISEHPKDQVADIMQPYRQYESQLRTIFAQDRQNSALNDPLINVLPLFTDNTKYITTRARDLASESEDEKSRYVMALPDDKRRPQGSPATVASLSEFQKNFNVFSESSLVDLNWDNVVAAGSSVVNTLLPVPKEFNTTKRKLREYYHEKFCPASDVDLFLYGLTHDQAIEKIKQIEQAIRDALLNEVTVVRTKYAITIASQYPVRHVQIVLRVYKSVSEILTGFDIDAAGGAYDGKQVYVTPRALGSFITQINQIDLTRRSPSYENRLSKYSHRNFEIYWPDLDRSRIDPTIFERSFKRTLGLARLLVLERLPTQSAREAYLNKRREERGRPTVFRSNFHLGGNIKDYHEDEVADWLSEEDVSNYHTFTVPYGQNFHAKRIEKLCYTRDLLLNAEWNQPKEREVYLHRHPAFFGRVEDVIEDCCGTCPEPKTDEEIEVAEKEAEIYISGKVSFLIDDPGRQQIGSFNPLTEDDWTDMAYVGNTARLCQSIVDGDIDDILNWLAQEGSDANKRDYTGRTPLHLAVIASNAEVVRCLVDHGARLTARLADGRTALHLAAMRGDTEMIKILMEKSIENEEAEEERQDKRRKAARSAKRDEGGCPRQGKSDDHDDSDDDEEKSGGDEESDGELIDGEQTDADSHSIVTGSFVKVKKGESEEDEPELEDSDDEPDYYQIDVLAWDVACSPLHLAVIGGHEDAVKLLCAYGADSILPIKFLNKSAHDEDSSAILTLTLALSLPVESAKSMAQLLLNLGAVSSQADAKGATAFHRYVESGKLGMIDTLLDHDKTGVKTAINHLVFDGSAWNPEAVAPLSSAIEHGDPILVLKLLNAGALPEIDFETWMKAAKVSPTKSSHLRDLESNKNQFRKIEQPIVTAIQQGNAEIAFQLLERGADPNTLTPDTEVLLVNEYRRRWTKGAAILDLVNRSIEEMSKYKPYNPQKPNKRPGLDTYLKKFTPHTYQHWVVSDNIKEKNEHYRIQLDVYETDKKKAISSKGDDLKREAIAESISAFENLKRFMLSKGAKTFSELHPDISKTYHNHNSTHTSSDSNTTSATAYEYEFRFNPDNDLTDKRRDAYIELMEAAWAGNLEKIKSFTLQAWGSEQNEPPLKMAIADGLHNTPFSLAFLRGHHDVAKAILEIVKAQYTPEDKDNIRYKLQTQGSDVSDEDEDEYSDQDSVGSEPQIVSEKVDKTFTIDNIGQVSMHVTSHTRPLAVITDRTRIFIMKDGSATTKNVRSLFAHTLEEEDAAGLKFLLDLAQRWAADKDETSNDDDESNGAFTFPQDDFQWALEHGKTQLLGLVIKRTGAGIPLDHLVKKSGVEMKKRPKTYQGLTVYGKKRKDWATAGRNMVVKTTGMKTPPLLHAALGGSIESVEFFLGDAPHRLYSEFAKSKAGLAETRLKHLKESPGGFDRAISRWLGADSERANELLQYLVETCPGAVEKKSSNGDTPLLVACRLGRLKFAQILIDANADQSVRNAKGENIVHAALAQNPTAHRLRPLLDMLDADLRSHLFLQRKNLSENGYAPVQAWIAQATGVNTKARISGIYIRYHYSVASRPALPYSSRAKDVVDLLKLLLEYSKGHGLDMLDGAGDTCLHTAIMKSHVAITKVLVDFNPSLLYRENAVGRTPAELAYDAVTTKHLSRPDAIRKPKSPNASLTKKYPSEFAREAVALNQTTEELRAKAEELGLPNAGDNYTAQDLDVIMGSMGLSDDNISLPLPETVAKRVILDICYAAIARSPSSRRLVSLTEANDVARRLGEQETRSRYFSVETRKDEDDDDEAKEEGDKSTEDFATIALDARVGGAWKVKHDDAEEPGFTKCKECDSYHE